MKISLTHILIIIFFQNGMSQIGRNANWILGYPPNIPEQFFGGINLQFQNDELKVNSFDTNAFTFSNSAISDENGKLICYTDGCRIYDGRHMIIVNGDSLNYLIGDEFWLNCDQNVGYVTLQGQLFIPEPGSDSIYNLIHLHINYDVAETNLLRSKIQMINGELVAIEKNKIIFTIKASFSQYITSVLHANGRDWWLIIPQPKLGTFFTLLLDPKGIIGPVEQKIGFQSSGAPRGQIGLSPDGTILARIDGFNGLDVLNFDRCTGTLSNPIYIDSIFDNEIDFFAGVAFSPNSKFLYVSNSTKLWQFECTDGIISTTPILIDIYDGFADPFPTNFYQSKLAINDKIYIAGSNSMKGLHIVDKPNLKGKSCSFIQNHIKFPVNITPILPNTPHYRLGPIDGAICDSLELNSIPIAKFNFTKDEVDEREYFFDNASSFGPTEYYWDFDDGYRSFEFEPTHSFRNSGTYEVCLTASNLEGSDTFCRPLTVDLMNEYPNELRELPKIFPNPVTSETLYLELPKVFDEKLEFNIYTFSGQLVASQYLDDNAINHYIEIGELLPEMYIYNIIRRSDKAQLYRGKFLVVK